MERLDWKKHIEGWPTSLVKFEVDPARTGLVVVDMQRYGCDPTSEKAGLNSSIAQKRPEMAQAWFSSLREKVVPNIGRLLDCFRKNDWPVIYFTLGVELPDGRDAGPILKLRGAFVGKDGRVTRYKGTPEHEVLAALQPKAGELVFNKTTMSGFASTGCDQVFRHIGLQYLVFAGVGTDACVFSTASDAADRGYFCVMVEDACTAQHPILHDAALLMFGINSGRVATTSEVIQELGRAAPTCPPRQC